MDLQSGEHDAFVMKSSLETSHLALNELQASLASKSMAEANQMPRISRCHSSVVESETELVRSPRGVPGSGQNSRQFPHLLIEKATYLVFRSL